LYCAAVGLCGCCAQRADIHKVIVADFNAATGSDLKLLHPAQMHPSGGRA
jgi:hypothetical protein